eukprot:gene1348-1702_t
MKVSTYLFILSLVLTLFSFGSVYSTKLEPQCSLIANYSNHTFIFEYFEPSIAKPALNFCLEYSNIDSCCTFNQTWAIELTMIMAQNLFGECKACINNVADMFCAMNCDQFQSTYFIPTKFKPNTKQILEVQYLVTNHYADRLYKSCRDISADGVPPFYKLYPTYQEFFTLFENFAPFYKIDFVYDDIRGYSSELESCKGSCPCSSCRESCTPDILNNITPKIKI